MRRFTAFLTVSGLVLALAPAALGADGDIAIFSEAAGTDVITTAVFDHGWDTTVRTSATYELGGDANTEIKLIDPGHYLVMYNSRFDSTGGSNRSEVQSNLAVNGIYLPTGWSQGYIRRSDGANECVTTGGGIVDVAANDLLKVQSFRTDNNAAGVATAANASGVQLLKLKDDWDYLRLQPAINRSGPGTTAYQDVVFDTQTEIDTDTFGHTVGSADILLKEAGHYLVLTNTYFQTGGNARTLFTQQLTLGGSPVEGSATTVHIRGGSSQSCQDGAASLGMIIETDAADTILNVEASKETGDTPTILSDKTAVTIVKLPDDADYIRLTDTTSQNMNPTALTAIGWDTELEINTDGFTHAGSQVGAAEEDDYLFLTAIMDEDSENVQRAVPWQRWGENGAAPFEYGQTASYNRHSSSAESCGNWSGLLNGMIAGDYVEVVNEALAATGTVTADILGLQGVRLSTLFPQPFVGYVSNELGDANWAEIDGNGFSHWLLDGSPTAGYPTASDDAIIRTDTIRVAEADGNQAVLSLVIETGGLLIDPNTTLAAGDKMTVEMATLDINGTLSMDKDLKTAGGATITIDGTLVAKSADIVDGATLVLTPNSTVTLPSLVSAGETTFGAGSSGAIDVLDVIDGNTILPAACPTIATINASGGILALDANVTNLNVQVGGTVNTATPVTIMNIDLSGGLLAAGADLDANTVLVSGGELKANIVTLTTPTITVSGGSVVAGALDADTVTTSGTGELTVYSDANFVTADLGGTATFWGTLTTTGNTLNVTGGTTAVHGVLTSPSVTVTGGALNANNTLTSDAVTVGGGALTVGGALTSPSVTITSGTLTANNTLTSDAVTVSGGTLVTNGDLSTTSQILVDGGTWDAHAGIITTVGDPNVALQITGGGGVNVYGAATLSGLGRIDIASDGGGSALNILAAQTGGFPGLITVRAGSLLFGDMTDANYADDPNRNVFFEDKAVFGVTAGPSPTVADLEAMSGPGTRLTGAIMGNDVAEQFEIGGGIYSGLAFGSWTAGPFMGDANSQCAFEIQTNGVGLGFQQPRFDLADANDIIRITGAGNFEWDIDANGTAKIFHREGPAGNIDTNVIRLGQPGDIPAGVTLRVTNGMINKYNGVDATIIDPNGILEVGENARLNNRSPFTQGTVRVLPGGIVVIDNAAELTSGTVSYEWDEDPNNPVNPKIALDTDQFDPANTAGFPKAADIILMHGGRADRYDGTGIVLGQDCRLTGRSGGNVDLDAAGVSLKAADYTTRVRISSPLSTDGTALRNVAINVDVDLRWDDGDGNTGTASLIVGDTEDYVTVQGDTDNTPVLTPQIGNVYINQNVWAEEITVLSGELRLGNTAGAVMNVPGDLIIDGGHVRTRPPLDAQLRAGTLFGGDMIVNDDGKLSLETATLDDNPNEVYQKIIVNSSTGTHEAGGWNLRIKRTSTSNNADAKIIRLMDLVLGDGAVLAAAMEGSQSGTNRPAQARANVTLMGTATMVGAAATDVDAMYFMDITGDPSAVNPTLNIGRTDGSTPSINTITVYGTPSGVTINKNGPGELQFDHGLSYQDNIGEDGWGSDLVLSASNQGILRFQVDEADAGGTNVNRFAGPVTIGPSVDPNATWTGGLLSQRARDAANNTGTVIFEDVRLEPGAIVRPARANTTMLQINDLTLLGDAGMRHNQNDNIQLGNIDANGDGHTLTIRSARHLRLFGVLDSSMTLRWDPIVAADNDNLDLMDSNYGEPGEGFRLNGATLDANQGLVRVYPNPGTGTIEVRGKATTGNGTNDRALDIFYGQNGETWGDGLVINVYNDRGLRFRVNADPNEALVNEINAEINIMPGARVWARPDRQTGAMTFPGSVQLNNLVLHEGSLFEARRDDDARGYYGGRMDGNGTFESWPADNMVFLTDWTGPGTMTVGGIRHLNVVGTLDIGGVTTSFDDDTKRLIFHDGSALIADALTLVDGNGGVQFDPNSTMTVGVANFDSNAITFYDGMTATIETANFNEPTMSFANNMNVALGTGNFNVDMDLLVPPLGSLTIDHGVLADGVTVTVTDVAGGAEAWSLGTGSELIANGTGTLDGASAIELTGGTLTARLNGPLTIAAPVTVIGAGADAVIDIDRFDANGGTDQTVTFASLLLEDDTDNPIISISSANDYNVAFGSTTLDSADRGQINVITSGTAVDLGPVTITSGTLGMDAVAGSMITVGPLDSGGDAAARLEFGRGGTYSGGGLILSDSDPNKWAGTIYVDSATLVIDSNFDGYDQGYHPTDPNNPSIIVGRLSMALGTRAITKVTYDSTVEGMTMHEYATLGLQLSNTMKDVVGPTGIQDVAYQYGDAGLAGGNLILDFADIDASFRQSDGNGGSMNMMLIEDAGARPSIDSPLYSDPTGVISTLAGANYHAPLDLIGTILLGDPDGLGEDFEISGIIADGCSPIEDLMWNVLGELMPGKLIKVGGEAVTLSHANTFTGGVDANEGTLVMADALALGDITGPGLSLQGGTLRIAVADANFDAAAGGYAFSMTNDSTVEVNAAGANLKPVLLGDGTLVINDQMVGATAPSAGPGPGARTVINVPDVSVDYVVGLQGTLDVPASATIHAIEDFGAADANTLFNIGAGQTLTIDDNETLDANRIWNVAGGTVLYSGDLTTTHTLRKAGAGTLTLAGANNSIPDLVIGTSPGGTVIVTSAGKVPDSVLIEAGSLYTVQKGDHNYNEVAAASAGIAALSAGSNAAIDFSDNTAYLGAVVDSTYSGDLTPSAAGYFLGGGGGRLTVDDLLADTPLAPNADAALGWADSHDNNVLFTEGVALLNAENTLTGNVQVNMEVIYLKKAFEKVESADGNWVWVNPGGMLDLNSTGAREDNIKVNGGAIANTGGTLDAGTIQNMFQTGDYMIGSNSGGSTGYGDGGFVRPDANLWKVGTDTAVMLDPIGGGDSNNTYAADVADPNVIRGHTTIQGGTLEIYNPTSLGGSGSVAVENRSTLTMRSAGALDAAISLNGTLEIQDASVLDLTDANGGLALTDAGSETEFSLFQGGGTIDLGGHVVTGSGKIAILDGGTIKASVNASSNSGAFIIPDGATVELSWDGNPSVAVGQMLPGGAVRFVDMINAGASGVHCNAAEAFDLRVDPNAWLANPALAGSSPAKPYAIYVSDANDGFFGMRQGSGQTPRLDQILTPTVVDDANGLVHHPVAYIEKTGPGDLTTGGTMFSAADANNGAKPYWMIKEGSLSVVSDYTEDDALGATAADWVNAGKPDLIAGKHLEGIEVSSGAALNWYGEVGFLPDTAWRDGNTLHEPGDGFNPGEFMIENGGALYGRVRQGLAYTDRLLTLGYQDGSDTYLGYPTLRSTDANLPTLRLGGEINLRSGVDANTLNANGSTYHAVVDGGRVEFSSDAPNALPADNIQTLTIMNAGTAVIRNTHAAVTDTQVQEFTTLQFDANAATVYNGTVFNEGLISVAPNSSADLGTTMITSSVNQFDVLVAGLEGSYHNFNARPFRGSGGLPDSQGDPNNLDGWNVFDNILDPCFPGPPTPEEDSVAEFRAAHSADVVKVLRQALDLPSVGNTTNGNMLAEIGVDLGNDDVVAFWEGEILIPADANYTFFTGSDDASFLAIDANIIVNNNEGQPYTERDGNTALTAGWHDVLVGFVEYTGGAGITASWQSTEAGIAKELIPVSSFRTIGDLLTGSITVDANATMMLGGFTDAGVVTVDGNMVFNGASQSSAHEVVINEGGVLDLGSAALNKAEIGVIRGTLRGTNVAVFDDLTIEGTSPAINLGLLRATNATVNSNFSFGQGVSTFDTLAVNANVSVDPGGELGVSSMAAISRGNKLSLNGGNVTGVMAVTVDGGELEITDGNGLNSGMDILNDGVVRVTNGAVADLTEVVITCSGVIGALPRADRLQAHWRFEDDLTDSSGNNRGGTMQGGAAVFVAGQVGKALSFDGADDVVQIPSYTGITGSTPRTMSAWIKGTKDDASFIYWGINSAGEKWNFRTQTSNGQAGAIRVEVNGGYIVGDTDTRDDQWYHAVAVLPEGATDVTQVLLYLNGQLQGTSASQGQAINTSGAGIVQMGVDQNNAYHWLGLMDEVAIWDVALTAPQIEALYNWGGTVGDITVDANSTLKVGGFTDAGTVTPAGLLELHKPLVTSTAEMVAIPDLGVMDMKASSLDANYGSLSGSLLGDGTALAKFRTRLTVEDAPGPAINLNGGPLQVAGEMLVKKDNFAFDSTHRANIGTLSMEGPISVKIEPTGNVSADLVNVGDAQTLVLKGGTTDISRIDNVGLVRAQAGLNDLRDTIITSAGLVPPPISEMDIGTAGNPQFPGYSVETDGDYMVVGGGTDIWSSTSGASGDHFHFVYTTLPDDVNELIARLPTIYNNEPADPEPDAGNNAWIKAGIMVRDYLDYDSAHASMYNTWTNGASFQRRTTGHATGNCASDTSGGAFGAKWLRLARSGNVFNGFYATTTGMPGPGDWVQLGGDVTMNWEDDELYVGLAITSHDNSRLETALLEQISFFAPVGAMGDIAVDSGAVLKLKGFTNAAIVRIDAGAKLELGSHNSTCLDLELDPTGLLDVGQSLEIMDDPNTTLADVRNDILAGRGGGGWSGSNWIGSNWNGAAGITSSVIRAGHRDEWSLVAIDPNTLNSDDEILIRITIIGDIDVDEDVDHDDLAILEANFDQPGGWAEGDVDLSGVVDFRDYLLWKAFYGREYDGPGSTIPEPATLVLLGLGGLAFVLRRRR